MNIVSLMDNKKKGTFLIKEHGLSFYVESEGNKVIFDTGASGDFVSNADRLGVKIEDIDYVIISHGHHDHGGGLFRFLHLNEKAKVIISENARKDFYITFSFYKKYIGLDKKVLDKFSERFIFIKEDFYPYENFHIVTNIKKNKNFLPQANNLKVLENSTLIDDSFDHEVMLVVKENSKIYIFTGCSHNGIIGMVETAKELYPNEEIGALIGGFHFMGNPILKTLNCSKNYINSVSAKINDLNINKIYTCHCTTKKGYKLLKKDLSNIDYIHTGMKIEFMDENNT